VSAARSITSSVEVAVDPDTAFRIFTEEIDCWWLQGPINFYDSARAYGHRFEAGVGGRIVEVYDEGSGDGLELARITAWEPGVVLGWQSSVDDVRTEVRFTSYQGGTVVEVEATVPDGGGDAGGTSWVRVVPSWLDRWVRARAQVRREPAPLGRLAIAVTYRDPGAAARWLRDVAMLDATGVVPEAGVDLDPEETWIEFRVGTSAVVVLGTRDELGDARDAVMPWVSVDDLDAHFEHARSAGATVLQPPSVHGATTYVLEDPQGVRWTFAQASPRMRRNAPVS
jgi:uncharacterized glyoxalase superfamily protein PhnB